MTTDWPHFCETASPSVRARKSTAPRPAYGTRICTDLEGNGCAEALPAAASIAAAAVHIRNHLMTSLPSFSLARLSHIVACLGRRSVQTTDTPGHVDNPGDRVKFRRLTTIGGHVANETSSRGTRRMRWQLPRPKPRPNHQVPGRGTVWCCKSSSAT